MTPQEQIKESILELQAALQAANPGFLSLLRTIHSNLKANQDVVTLLDEEEIGIVVSGLMRHANVVIATKPASKSARMKSVSVDDL